jgi:hypothetical protein
MNMSASKSVNVQGVRSLFRVVAVTDTSARLEDENHFQFDAPRRHVLEGEEIILQPGWIISAIIKIGSQTEIEDVFV